MNWLDKIHFMKNILDQNGRYGTGIDADYFPVSWTIDELQTLKDNHPDLPRVYLDFIQEFDSIGISWVTFYGSRANDIIPLLKEIDYWREEGLPEEYFPFGKGPGGEVYCFNKQNEVIEFASDDYEFGNPVTVASSLEIFIDQCLLGPRYTEFNYIDEDTFYEFMKVQGWV